LIRLAYLKGLEPSSFT